MCEDLVKDRPVLEAIEPHLALALVVDVSASMQIEENGIKRINSLNKAINSMIDTINEDARLRNILDLGIFVFGEKDREPVYQGFRAISECEHITLQANDNETWVSDALNTAVDRLRERTNRYAQGGGAYKPWLVLITDGQFFDGSELNIVASRMKQRELENKLQFFGLGVQGYDRSQLEKLTNMPNHVIDVKAANFAEFLSWVGRSFATISQKPVDATDIELPPLIFKA